MDVREATTFERRLSPPQTLYQTVSPSVAEAGSKCLYPSDRAFGPIDGSASPSEGVKMKVFVATPTGSSETSSSGRLRPYSCARSKLRMLLKWVIRWTGRKEARLAPRIRA